MECLHSQVYQFGKLFQDCKAAEELFRVDKVNELQRDLMVRMKNNFFFRDIIFADLRTLYTFHFEVK